MASKLEGLRYKIDILMDFTKAQIIDMAPQKKYKNYFFCYIKNLTTKIKFAFTEKVRNYIK